MIWDIFRPHLKKKPREREARFKATAFSPGEKTLIKARGINE